MPNHNLNNSIDTTYSIDKANNEGNIQDIVSQTNVYNDVINEPNLPVTYNNKATRELSDTSAQFNNNHNHNNDIQGLVGVNPASLNNIQDVAPLANTNTNISPLIASQALSNATSAQKQTSSLVNSELLQQAVHKLNNSVNKASGLKALNSKAVAHDFMQKTPLVNDTKTVLPTNGVIYGTPHTYNEGNNKLSVTPAVMNASDIMPPAQLAKLVNSKVYQAHQQQLLQHAHKLGLDVKQLAKMAYPVMVQVPANNKSAPHAQHKQAHSKAHNLPTPTTETKQKLGLPGYAQDKQHTTLANKPENNPPALLNYGKNKSRLNNKEQQHVRARVSGVLEGTHATQIQKFDGRRRNGQRDFERPSTEQMDDPRGGK